MYVDALNNPTLDVQQTIVKDSLGFTTAGVFLISKYWIILRHYSHNHTGNIWSLGDIYILHVYIYTIKDFHV